MTKNVTKVVAASVDLNSCVLTTIDNERIDIKHLISNINITESLYSLYAIYDIIVSDAVALMEVYGITGNEKIEIEFSKNEGPSQKSVKKKLAITSFKEYVRPRSEMQNYRIQAVCETALLSSILRINRSVEGKISELISTFYSEIEYELPLNQQGVTDEGIFKGVIPNMTYNEAISYLLSKCQNAKGDTFHMFETLWDGMVFTSYSSMIKKAPVDTYKLTENTEEISYEEQRTKIKDIDSQLGMSNYETFKNGGGNARTHIIDIATKTYTFEDASISDGGLPKMDKEYALSTEYKLAGKSFSDIDEPRFYVIHKNSMSYEGDIGNFNNKDDESKAKKTLVLENQYALNHTILLAGEPRLICGNVISIHLPQTTEPTAVSEHKDELMSGNYLIYSAVHSYKSNSAYTISLSIKKDSLDRQKAMSKYKKFKG